MDKYSKLSYFIIDVDGTLTDSGIYYADSPIGLKRFSTKDKAGVIAANFVGIKTVVVTGRQSAANETRLNEMGIDYIFQGVKNKKEFIRDYMNEQGLKKENLGYIGDDLNDYGAMQLAGFVACPKDSTKEIMETADYISSVNGGYGVIQDVFRHVLTELNKWDEFLKYIKETGF